MEESWLGRQGCEGDRELCRKGEGEERTAVHGQQLVGQGLMECSKCGGPDRRSVSTTLQMCANWEALVSRHILFQKTPTGAKLTFENGIYFHFVCINLITVKRFLMYLYYDKKEETKSFFSTHWA